MKIKIEEIKELLTTAALKYVSKEEAEYFAQEQIECTLRMYPDVNPIEEAVDDLENWKKLKDVKQEVLVDKPGTLLIDFHELAPTVKLKYIHDEIEMRAKKNGIAVLGMKNSSIPVWLKLLTNGLAKRDMIAIFMVNGGSESAVPYGGTESIFGTNPLSYAIPTNEEPILVDMATSESAFYKYSRARKSQTLFKENTFADENGNPTNDPQKGFVKDGSARILPMGGGYKGYNIIFLVEVLTGALVRSKMGKEKTSAKYITKEYGGLLMVIDVASLTDVKQFKDSVSAMGDSIRSQKPGSHVDKVIVPGDKSRDSARELLKGGYLEMEEELIKKLQA